MSQIESTPNTNSLDIPTYRILSKSSGLRVFPIALGTMHFGNDPLFQQGFVSITNSNFKQTVFSSKNNKGVGGNEEEQEKIFLDYIQRGGNFIDTANFYQKGQSETMIGNLIKKHNINRNDLVIATKYTLPMDTKPNQGGNHKKNLVQSVEQSLKRLQVEYIDILYVHFWDHSCEVTELMRWLDDIVKSGKVIHVAISDCPAWVVTKANIHAKIHALSPFVAYQGQYSLVERSVEQEVLPMSKDLDLGFIPWGIVGQGKLTGRFKRNQEGNGDNVRKVSEMSELDFQIQDKVLEIAKEIGRSPTQVAINWVLHKKGIPSVLIGPRTFEQYLDNMKALEFKLTEEQVKQLDEVSKNSPNIIFPHKMIGNSVQNTTLLYIPTKKFNIE
ncbi:hypothetical protein ABK040_007685 [Willaertia magna]